MMRDLPLDPPDDQEEADERDPDIEMEEREERKRIAMEMDGPPEEAP